MRFSDIECFDVPSYRIHVDWKYMNSVLKDYEDNGNLIYDPDFQRGYVWTKHQQSQYVEYMLRGGIGGREIYFNHPGWQRDYHGDMLLVDGKQRIKAVKNFMTNEVKVFDHYLREYEDKFSRHLCFFYFNVNNLDDYNDVIRWYISMNSGGSMHTNEDIERALKCIKGE